MLSVSGSGLNSPEAPVDNQFAWYVLSQTALFIGANAPAHLNLQCTSGDNCWSLGEIDIFEGNAHDPSVKNPRSACANAFNQNAAGTCLDSATGLQPPPPGSVFTQAAQVLDLSEGATRIFLVAIIDKSGVHVYRESDWQGDLAWDKSPPPTLDMTKMKKNDDPSRSIFIPLSDQPTALTASLQKIVTDEQMGDYGSFCQKDS